MANLWNFSKSMVPTSRYLCRYFFYRPWNVMCIKNKVHIYLQMCLEFHHCSHPNYGNIDKMHTNRKCKLFTNSYETMKKYYEWKRIIAYLEISGKIWKTFSCICITSELVLTVIQNSKSDPEQNLMTSKSSLLNIVALLGGECRWPSETDAQCALENISLECFHFRVGSW